MSGANSVMRKDAMKRIEPQTNLSNCLVERGNICNTLNTFYNSPGHFVLSCEKCSWKYSHSGSEVVCIQYFPYYEHDIYP
jgi:hypothetical protein